MERIVERPGALDVHQASVTACVRVWHERQLEEHMAEFGTTIQSLLGLRDWREALGVKQVVISWRGCQGKAGRRPCQPIDSERGNHPALPSLPLGGWADPSSADGAGWDGALVVVRAGESPVHGEGSRFAEWAWKARRSSLN